MRALIENIDGEYYVDITGRVYSAKRKRFLIQQINRYGYATIHLGRKRKIHFIHRLIATYFIPNLDNLPEVNHKDGNKLNNNIDNLEWCTRSHNISHAFQTGLRTQYGEDNPNSKLTLENIADIKMLRQAGLSYQKIGDKYGVAHSTISRIFSGFRWAEAQ